MGGDRVGTFQRRRPRFVWVARTNEPPIFQMTFKYDGNAATANSKAESASSPASSSAGSTQQKATPNAVLDLWLAARPVDVFYSVSTLKRVVGFFRTPTPQSRLLWQEVYGCLHRFSLVC